MKVREVTRCAAINNEGQQILQDVFVYVLDRFKPHMSRCYHDYQDIIVYVLHQGHKP